MMSEKIRVLMLKRNLNGIGLSKVLGCTSQNVYGLLKKDNWCEKDLQKAAEGLNCDLEINLILRDTGERI